MKKYLRRLILGIMLLLIIRSLGIAWHTVEQFRLYRQLDAAGAPTLRIALHMLLGISGLVVVGWRRECWWVWLTVYVIVDGLWILFYVQSDFDRGRIPYVAVTSGGFVGLIWWLRQKKLFGEQHDSRA